MREIGLEELKYLQLDILDKVDKFCRKNNYKYTLFYGTLLGAIRHQGYIPWDDDIDIAMPRPYYDKFLRYFNGSYNELHVLAPEIDPNYYAPYANVCDKRTLLIEGRNGHRNIEVGVKIDIFPIDSTPQGEDNYVKLKSEIIRINNILWTKRVEVPPVKFLSDLKIVVKKILFSKDSYANLQKEIMRKVKCNSYMDSELVDCIVYQQSDVRMKRSDYEEYVDVSFENLKLMSIQNYNEYLCKLYGDYMQFPPESERIPHHGFTAYWKDGYELDKE